MGIGNLECIVWGAYKIGYVLLARIFKITCLWKNKGMVNSSFDQISIEILVTLVCSIYLNECSFSEYSGTLILFEFLNISSASFVWAIVIGRWNIVIGKRGSFLIYSRVFSIFVINVKVKSKKQQRSTYYFHSECMNNDVTGGNRREA